MTFFAAQVVNGIALGGVYALLALGFSLVFGAANIINFTQGSLFVGGAFATLWFTAHLGAPLWLAALLAIAFSALLGFIVDLVALRPIARGPLVAPLLTTIALSVILDQSAQLVFGPQNQPFPNPFAGNVAAVGGTFLGLTDAIVVGSAVVAAGLLMVFLQRTWTGRAIRASAQDAQAAMQMGVRIERVRSITFALAGALGGLGGVLVGLYFQTVAPSMGLAYGIKGFAAAILGGIASFPGAIAGGVVLGVAESLASGYLGEGWRDVVAYALLLAALLWRPQGLFGTRRFDGLGGVSGASGGVPSTSPLATAGADAKPLRPWTPRPPVAVGIAMLALAVPLVVHDAYVLGVLGTAAIFAVVAVGLTLVAGTAGQISLGFAAVFGTGAYVAAIVAKAFGWPIEVVLPLAGLGGALCAVIVSLPVALLSGHVVALATLAAGELVYLVMLTWLPVTRGPLGIPAIPAPALAANGGVPLDSPVATYELAALLAIVAVAFAQWFVRARIGRTLRALREDRIAARASGISPVRTLALVNAAGGVLAGAAGALFAYTFAFVSPDSFDPPTSILLLTMVVVGGLGNPWGALTGGVALAVLPQILRGLLDIRLLVYGAILLVVFRVRAQGIAGAE